MLYTTAGTLSPVTNNNNGTYTATLTSATTIGTARITGTLVTVAITDDAPVTGGTVNRSRGDRYSDARSLTRGRIDCRDRAIRFRPGTNRTPGTYPYCEGFIRTMTLHKELVL
jgi:hypothetical protein